MANLFNYIPEEVTVLVAGILPIDGYIDGTFVNISKDIVPFSSKRTPDGSIARLYNRDQTYTIEITLHNGSDSNDFLTKLWQLDEITQGRGKFPLFIKDSSGSDLFFSTSTWIEQIPSLTKSNGIDARTWILRSAFAVINVGSNAEPSDIVNDLINSAASALPALGGII